MTARKRPARRGAREDRFTDAGRRRPRSDPGPGGFLARHRPELVLGLMALGIRLIVLMELSDSPSFQLPLVDSEIYDRAARDLANGTGLGEAFFYQPFLYPFLLGVIYAVSGSSIVFAKIIQAVVGSLTCVLVAVLGRRLFDRTTGMVAGALTAVNGPLLFFEGELLATGLAGLWSALLPLLLLAVARRPAKPLVLITGACCGLAVLTRPTYLPYVVAVAAWLGIQAWREFRKQSPAIVALLVGGFLSVTLPVAWASARHTGEVRFLPASGGLNLFLGNNPDRCATLRVRPGQQWHELVTAPAVAGAEGLWEEDRWFRSRVREYVVGSPVSAMSDLVLKAVEILSSREIPRNLDVYLFRRWSGVLRATVWKIGSFGFPFGVLFPLAVLGGVVGWRRLPAPVTLMLILYPLSVIAVFVSARYRAPVIPVMTIVAAAGLMWAVRSVRERVTAPGLVTATVAITAALLVTTVPGPFCQEDDLESEYWFLVNAARLRAGDVPGSEKALRRAVGLEPDYLEARYQLGIMLLERGELDEAVVHLGHAVQLEPDSAFAHRELGMALGRLGKFQPSRYHLERAFALAPDDVKTLNNLGALSAREGNLDAARVLFERALIADPSYRPARENLEYVMRQLAADGTPPRAGD